jgi:hypothetical protein
LLIANDQQVMFRYENCSGRMAEVSHMLLTLAIILLVAWLLGLFAFKVTAAFIHLLIVVAVVLFVLHFIRGRGRV